MQLEPTLKRLKRSQSNDVESVFSDIVDILTNNIHADVVWLEYTVPTGQVRFLQSDDLFDTPPLERPNSIGRVALETERFICETNGDIARVAVTKKSTQLVTLAANPLQLNDGWAVLSVGWRHARLVTDEDRRIIELCTKLGGIAMESAARQVQLLESYNGMVSGLLLALELRDFETVAHSRRVVTYTLLLAERMGVDSRLFDELALGAALHDVGKIALSDAILRKPGKLTNAEFALVRQHPVIGYNMLRSSLRYFPIALQMVRHHHERFDGAGYPDGLVGRDIPFAARLLALADSFDVMTNDRPYKRAMSIEEARREVLACRGTQFCPECADALLSIEPSTLEAVRRGELDRAPICDAQL